MPVTAAIDAEALHPLLQSKIGQMSDQEVVVLHRLLLKLEARRLWDEIKAEGEADRAAGKFEDLDQIIAQVRAELAAS